MPRRRPQVCSRPGCPFLTLPGESRCRDCDTAADRARGTAAERGYDARWRATRSAFIAEHPFCTEEFCARLAGHVDHIDGLGPLAPRGHDWSNLRGLCATHHNQRTARDQPGGWNRRSA